MIKVMLIGIVIAWVVAFVGPAIIKSYHNHKKGDKSEE